MDRHTQRFRPAVRIAASTNGKPRILFACVGNTCRSVLAEYLTRHGFGDYAEPSSAGLRPQKPADAENAVLTLSTFGIDASNHQPRSLDTVDLHSFDIIIAMKKDIAREVLAKFSLPADRLRVWNIADPFGDNLEEYQRCARKILVELRKLLRPKGYNRDATR